MERKTVLITGASKGIGAAIAIKFAQNNYNIILNYNQSEKEAINLKQKLEKYNIKVLAIKANIENEIEIKNMIEMSIKTFEKIDVLINNAGIAIDTQVEDKTIENFDKIIHTNLIGPFICSREYAKYTNFGTIINIASTNGIDTYYPYSLDYDSSKAGLISLTHNLAKEYSPNIRVNAIAPGWVNTEMNINLDKEYKKSEEEKIFLKRFAEPEEIASVAYFLASQEAKYINNEVIRVDGGTYHA